MFWPRILKEPQTQQRSPNDAWKNTITKAFALKEHGIEDVQMEGHNKPEAMYERLEDKNEKMGCLWQLCGFTKKEVRLLRPNNPQRIANPRLFNGWMDR